MSGHFDGKRFRNLDPSVRGAKGLLEVLRWKMANRRPEWPRWVDHRVEPDLPAKVKEGELFVTYINHSTALIQFAGLTILTDPVFSHGIGPHWGPKVKRVHPPGLSYDHLPRIDRVVISHNHFDHFDLPSLKEINKRDLPLFIVPLGNRKLLQKIGIQKICELDWWEKYEEVVLTPAQHWSGRHLLDRYHSLWGSFFFSYQGLKVFFAGDTGYNTHFKTIRSRLGEADISLLPIGAYLPRWFMGPNHMDPEEAVRAHLDLGSKLSMAIHFDTFHLADELFGGAEKELKESILRHGIGERAFIVPQPGQTIANHLHYRNAD